MTNAVFNSSNIKLSHLDAKCVANHGLELSAPDTLVHLGWDDWSAIASLRVEVISGSVQKSPHGVIQDPAGSAVGNPADPAKQAGVGGASKAIYAQFPDLKPIPDMAEGASVFNTSTGSGRRVLHTYSPRLAGTPQNLQDCATALERLANAYCNALMACNALPAALANTADAALVNLVPISGAIFAGSFVSSFQGGVSHLHPSYTLTAIAIAQLVLAGSGAPVLPATLYYHDLPVYQAALGLVAPIYGPQT